MEHLDERFLVISGDVLTDIDLTRHRRLPRSQQAPWPPSASAHVDNPLEFGIVITHEDGTIERFLEKPTWGQVFSDTINTGIFVLEPEIFDYIEPDRRRLLVARSSPSCSTRACRSTAPSPRATGRTSARSRRTCGPTRTSSTPRSRSRSPASRSDRGLAGWRAPRCTPTPPSSGPPSSARTAASRPVP